MAFNLEKGMRLIAAVASFFGVSLSYLIKEDTATLTPPRDQGEAAVTRSDLAKMEESIIEKIMEREKNSPSVASPWPQYGATPITDKELRLLRAFRGLTEKGQDLVLDFATAALKDHKAPVRSKRAK